MKCSSCGANTWISHGTGRAVLCKKCFDEGGAHNFVYFKEPPVNSEEASVKFEEAPVNSEDTSAIFEETQVKSGDASGKLEETQVNSDQVPVNHKASLLIAKFVSFIGWLICCIAIFGIFVSLTGEGKRGLFSLVPSLGLFSGGLLFVVVGQTSRALFDNTNYTRQILEIMKKET